MSAVGSSLVPAADLAAVKTRQQAAWSTGNYAVVGTMLQIVGESLCEALDLRAGAAVLDVAAGNGNATLAASRQFTVRYRSPAHFIEVFRTYYGPINKAFGALDAAKQEEFNNELLALIARGNRLGDGTTGAAERLSRSRGRAKLSVHEAA